MPPLMIGAMKQALKNVSEDELRHMVGQVAVGMTAIYHGKDVQTALSESLHADEKTVRRIVATFQDSDQLTAS